MAAEYSRMCTYHNLVNYFPIVGHLGFFPLGFQYYK